MTDADRIRLAEARGWTCIKQEPWGVFGRDPDRNLERLLELPDPENDANDCEALIRWLNEQGWFFHRQDEGGRTGDDLIKPVQTMVRIHRHRPYIAHEWRGDNWKQGVCELALTVIPDE